MSNTTHVLNEQQTATKAPKVLKKRGRKGNKIDTAFKKVPEKPVNFEKYCKKHGVTTNVLRQIKRHDHYKDTGKVFIRKNKDTKKIMIWREAPINS